MKTIVIILASLSFSLWTCAQNTDINVVANISNVTIYNASAEINYEKEIELPEGKVSITFSELTPFIVENTFNVSASASDVDIITVMEKINHLQAKKAENSTIEKLQDSVSFLNKDIGLIKCKIDALNGEKALLFKDESIGGVSKGVAVSEIEKASAFYSKRYLELASEIFVTSELQRLQEEKRNKYTNQINELTANTNKASSEITLVVMNHGKKQKVIFRFKFLTPKSGWAPVYDCKYQGAGKPIKFVFSANVFNATGTPWEGVSIKLSTASPTNGFNAPSMKNVNANNGAKNGTVPEVQFKEIQISNAIAEYDIAHKYSIPSDAKPYLVDVNAYEMNAEYHYLVIPKLDAFGFLMAKIPDWNQYNLNPGTTNIYNKGSYMGKTFLNTYPDNDTLSLYLGKDNTIQARITEVTSNNQRNIIGNYYVENSKIEIKIRNSSSESFKIELLDQVPVFSEREKVKFSIENIEQALYNKNEGLLTWPIALAGGESLTINYQYEIKVPKDDFGSYRQMKRKYRTIACPSF